MYVWKESTLTDAERSAETNTNIIKGNDMDKKNTMTVNPRTLFNEGRYEVSDFEAANSLILGSKQRTAFLALRLTLTGIPVDTLEAAAIVETNMERARREAKEQRLRALDAHIESKVAEGIQQAKDDEGLPWSMMVSVGVFAFTGIPVLLG